MKKRIFDNLCIGLVLAGCLANGQNPSPVFDTKVCDPRIFNPRVFDVKTYGAKGDGKAVDTPAINCAIDSANATGGGTVFFPAGTYLSFTIRLKSNVALFLDRGAVILAGDPASGVGSYDMPEPNVWDMYQDFGHSHWKNSLIWGEGLENVSILGPGLIDGKGLTRRGPGARRPVKAGDTPTTLLDKPDPVAIRPDLPSGAEGQFKGMDGQGNKAIALKSCRNVTLRDFSMLSGGHFALLATGVDNLTIDNLQVDTNRDGFDIDCCRNVVVSNCKVNSPNDDAIVIKSSYALGFAKPTENVAITNCLVSGYDQGTLLDGTFKRTQERAPDRDGVTGRIKIGTESNGGFRNIAISNCVFERCRGLALETVDGALLEDVVINNITMRDIVNAPIFLRLGSRMRGPEGIPIGSLQRVTISNVTVYNADPRYASIIAGIPGHPVEDVTLSHIRILARGGGTKEDAAAQPPEKENAYPEPSMFGTTPAYGWFIRHAKGIRMDHIQTGFMEKDMRPAFVLNDAANVHLDQIEARREPGVPAIVLKRVENVRIHECPGLADKRIERVEFKSL
jgi:polygalacturonase